MNDIFFNLQRLLDPSAENLWRLGDIVLVAFLIYRVLIALRGTRTVRVVLGIAVYLLLLIGTQPLHLRTLHWLLDKALILGPAALVILLLPELRHTLEGLGRLGTLSIRPSEVYGEEQGIEEMVTTVFDLASQKVGALIVIERASNLDEIAASGVPIGARVSSPLLVAIFYEGNPLHDGAVIVRNDQIVAAACRLPLSESKLERSMHMRHRAAVGVAEAFDCLVIVVSEERGAVSVASEGRLVRIADARSLREALHGALLSTGNGKNGTKQKILRRETKKAG